MHRGLLAALQIVIVAACIAGCGAVDATEPELPAAAAAQSPGTGGVNSPAVRSRPHVVLVSFDGFHPGYFARFDTPSFDLLAARGVRAAGLVSVFPSLTFPGHYSIATGLHPEAHGVTGNRFFDPVRRAEFSYRRRDDAQDGSWWGGEPLWVTAEKQGMVSAAFFFPGTEADVGAVRPSHWAPTTAGCRTASGSTRSWRGWRCRRRDARTWSRSTSRWSTARATGSDRTIRTCAGASRAPTGSWEA